MNGRVKWFSRDKGYGFLVGEDGRDRFFGVRDVMGADLPAVGDEVDYEPREGARGPAASNISILSSRKEQAERSYNSGKIECPHCRTLVYPRLVTYKGNADKSLCPLCGGMIKDFVGKWRLLPVAIVIAAIVIAMSAAALFSYRSKSGQARSSLAGANVVTNPSNGSGSNAPINYVPNAPQQAVGAVVAWARREQASQLSQWLRKRPKPPACTARDGGKDVLPDEVRYHLVEDANVRQRILSGLEPVLPLVGCSDARGIVLYHGQTVSAFNLPNNQIAITPDASYFDPHYTPDEHIFYTLGILRLFLAREIFDQMIPVEQPSNGLTVGDMQLRRDLKVNYLAAITSLTVDRDPEILERAALDISLYGNSKTVEDYTTGRTRSAPTLQQIQDVFGAAKQDFK